MRKLRIASTLAIIVFGQALLATNLPAQTVSGFFRVGSHPRANSLVNLLRNNPGDLTWLPDSIYEEASNINLPDLVFFFDTIQSTSQVKLIQRGGKKTEIFGEPYIHCLIFAVRKVHKTDSAEKKKEGASLKFEPKEWRFKREIKYQAQNKDTSITLTKDTTFIMSTIEKSPDYTAYVSLTQIGFEPSGGEIALISGVKALISQLFTKTPEGKAEFAPTKDTSFNVEMWPYDSLIDSQDGDSQYILLYRHFKVRIVEGTVNRVTVYMNDTRITGTATFGNYSDSRLGLGIALIGGFVDENTEIREDIHDIWIKSYLLGQIYLKRPNIPTPHLPDSYDRWKRRLSISLVGGPRLTTDGLFDDFFFGLSVGHMIGPLGIVIGGTWRTPRKSDDSKESSDRIWHKAVGINLTL